MSHGTASALRRLPSHDINDFLRGLSPFALARLRHLHPPSPKRRNAFLVTSGNACQQNRSHSSPITHFTLPLASPPLVSSRRSLLPLVHSANSFLLGRGAYRNLPHRSLATLGHVTSSMDNDRPYTVVVEGNIGSGKTTFLQHFASAERHRGASRPIETFQEPVNKWREVKGHNTLALMYEDPKRWSLTFQTYVQLTMVDLHSRKTVDSNAVKMMERSIYSAKYCFVENLKINGTMPEVEYVVLTEWFDWLISRQSCDVDLIVYLRTSPEVVYERIKRRRRQEEKAIPLEYLRALHRLHERWLTPDGASDGVAESIAHFPLPAPVLVIDGNCSNEEMVQTIEKYRERILGKGPRLRDEEITDGFGEASLRKDVRVVNSLCTREEEEEEGEEEEEEEEANSQNGIRSPSQKRRDIDEEEDRTRISKVLKVLN